MWLVIERDEWEQHVHGPHASYAEALALAESITALVTATAPADDGTLCVQVVKVEWQWDNPAA